MMRWIAPLLGMLAGCPPVADTDTWTPDTDVDWTPGDPVAYCEATADNAAPLDGVVGLSGENSYDPAQQGISSYAWTMRSAPPGSRAPIANSTSSEASIAVDVAGTYLAELVVTASDGRVSAPCSIPAHAVPTQSLWIELTWTLPNDDLDLHLIRGDGVVGSADDCTHVNCEGVGGHSQLSWGAEGEVDDPIVLVDDDDDIGPEIVEIVAPASGAYAIAVSDAPRLVENGANSATVRVFIDGVLASSMTRTVIGEPAAPMYFATVDFPSRVVTPCSPSGC